MSKKKKSNLFFPPWETENTSIGKEIIEEFLTNRYSFSKVPKDIDTIVIGSGISGLSSGVFLAKVGKKKCLILEQFSRAGGSCVAFTEDGYEFETGVNYCDDFGNTSLNNILSKFLSEGQMEWLSYGDIMDTIHLRRGSNLKKSDKNDDYDTYLFQSEKLFVKGLCERFPKEKENVINFVNLARKIFNETFGIVALQVVPILIRYMMRNFWAKNWQKYLNWSVPQLLNYFFKDNELKRFLAFFVTLLGDYDKVPASCYLYVMYCYLRNSAYFPKGGSGSIPNTFGGVFKRHGGIILTGMRVKSIIVTKNGRVEGVVMDNGDKISCKNVISTCGFHNTYNFLPKLYRPKMLKELPRSGGQFFVFLGFNCTHSEIGIPNSNVVFVNEMSKSNEWLAQKLEDVMKKKEFKPPYISVSNHNHVWTAQKGKSTFIANIDVPYEWFKKWEDLPLRNRGNDYKEVKEWFTSRILEGFLFKRYPKMKEHLEVCFSATPLTVKFFLGADKGEVFGIQQNKDRYLKYYDSFVKNVKVKNLYVAGQDAFLSHGITPSLYSSLFACEKILKRKLFDEAERAQKILNKKDTI